ncbi:FRG domain-containing protein [Elizabethkingia anophelis]|nr:FRG domain-containing protein [Elizabethkingia anophelis]MDV3499154.1 hypothetical protein [Elizabethkingia anophelis]
MNEITSIADFLKHLQDDNIETGFYRGHSDKNYVIKPSLGRNPKKFNDWLFEIDINNEELSDMQRKSIGLQQYEWWALSEFKARKIPYHSKNLNYFDLMILAQHHGLRTRLLDVTTNPLVALYFACDDNSKDGELIIFDKSWQKMKTMKTGVNDEIPQMIGSDIRSFLLFIRTIDNYTFVRPSHLSSRIISQDGNFIMFKQPLQEIEEESRIIRYLILKENKVKLKSELKKLGFVKSKLFPELNSVASEIDFDLFN